MTLSILILGAGATGGYFGGRLAELGDREVEVTFLVRPSRARSIAEKGLVIKGVLGNFTWPIRAVVEVGAREHYDLIVVACKAYDLESAIESIAPAVGANTLILPILNGRAHFDRLDERFGHERVLGGCCHLVASLDPDGVITLLGDLQRITYGARSGNAPHATPTLERLHAAYRRTPVDARLSGQIDQDIWEKFVFLSSLAAVTCLMRASIGDIMSSDDGEAIVLRVMAECEAAARHAGYPPRPKAVEIAMQMLTARGSTLTASMLRDLEAGGRLESRHIVGDMLRLVRHAGSDASVLRMAWAHLQAHEARAARERRTQVI